MNLLKTLKHKCGLLPTKKTLRQEIEKLISNYQDLTIRYARIMRFNIAASYALTEIMQSNDKAKIKKIVTNLIKELPDVNG